MRRLSSACLAPQSHGMRCILYPLSAVLCRHAHEHLWRTPSTVHGCIMFLPCCVHEPSLVTVDDPVDFSQRHAVTFGMIYIAVLALTQNDDVCQVILESFF